MKMLIINILTFIEILLCSRHCSVYFTCINSFYLPKNLWDGDDCHPYFTDRETEVQRVRFLPNVNSCKMEDPVWLPSNSYPLRHIGLWRIYRNFTVNNSRKPGLFSPIKIRLQVTQVRYRNKISQQRYVSNTGGMGISPAHYCWF